MSELREAIARALCRLHLQKVARYDNPPPDEGRIERGVNLHWGSHLDVADAALAAIEARGMVVVPVAPLPVERERVEAIAKRWLADPDIRRKIAADRAMIVAARTED